MRSIMQPAALALSLTSALVLVGCGSCFGRAPDAATPISDGAVPFDAAADSSLDGAPSDSASISGSDAIGPCIPDDPPWEVCDGRDNDCDGSVDLPGCAPGLEAWYRFEETTGMVLDSSGNGWHGTPVGAVLRGIPAVIGSGLGCVGGTDRVEVPGPSFDASTGWTVEAWVGYPTWPAGNYAVSKATGTSTPNVDITLQVDAPAIISANVFWNACDPAYCSAPIEIQQVMPATSFAHVAISYDGFFLREYFNGLEAGSLLDSIYAPETWDEDLVLCNLTGSPGESWDGLLDELKFWSVARTEGEICADAGGTYSMGPPASCVLP